MEQVEKKLQTIEQELGKFVNKQAEEVSMIGKAHEETRTALNALSEKAEAMAAKAAMIEKQQEQLDNISMKLQGAMSAPKAKTVKGAFAEELKNHANELKALKSGSRSSVNFEVKADMTTGADYTGDVIAPDHDTTIYRDPVQNTLRIRTLLGAASTVSNVFRFIQRSGFNDGTARVAEGATIPQSDFDLTAVERTIQKIGARMDFTKEMLEDTPLLQSFIVSELVDRAIVKEDQQLLYGTGTNQLYGVSAEAASYADDGLALSNVNEIDVLINAAAYLERTFKYMTNGLLINPKEYYKMFRLKDSQGEYLNKMLTYEGGQLRLVGLPVFKSTAVTAGDFFVGDWRSYGKIVDRQGMLVEFSDQNGSNFEDDEITAKVTFRLLLAATNPNAVIYGNFANALALGSA